MSETRARRSATVKVNYAKEQEFSDEDLFEDDDLPTPVAVVAPTTTRRKKVRKSKSSSTTTSLQNVDTTNELNSNYIDNRPVYTEKGYDPNLLPIRERFPFMPEYEEDGTSRIELIVGRRAIDDLTKEEEIDSDADEGNDNKGDDDDENDDNLTEKSPKGKMKSARAKRGKKKDDTPEKVEAINPSSVIEYEYLVKYKGRSYLHLEWKTGADLESMNKSAKGIYSRYLRKIIQGTDEDIENPEFDPSFAVPEKIIDEAEQEITIELTDKELTRWEKQREKELALEKSEEEIDELEQDEGAEEKKTSDPLSEKASNATNGDTLVDGEKKGKFIAVYLT